MEGLGRARGERGRPAGAAAGEALSAVDAACSGRARSRARSAAVRRGGARENGRVPRSAVDKEVSGAFEQKLNLNFFLF